MAVARNFDDPFEARPVHAILAVLLAFASALAAMIILRTLWWEARNLFAVPAYDDMFDHLRMYKAMSSLGEFLHYMVSPHNEHRIFTTRLLSIIDDRFFASREYTQVIFCNLVQAFSAWICWRVMIRHGGAMNLHTKIALLVATLTLFLNPAFLYTLIYPFQVQHAIMGALCVGGCAVVANASRSSQLTSRELALLLTKLLMLAVVATFTLGNAPVILIAATGTAIVIRWPRKIIVMLCVLTLVHIAVALSTTTPATADTTSVTKILHFALYYWGGLFSRFDAWPGGFVAWMPRQHLALVFGVVVLVVPIVFAGIRFFRPGWGGPAAAFGLMLLLIVLVTGLAAGHARAGIGVLEGASKKYASFAALGWVGILAIVFGAVTEFRRVTWPLREWLLLGALVILLPLSISGYDRETRIWAKWRETSWEAALAVFLEVNDKGSLHALDQDPYTIPVYVDATRPRNASIFSYFPFRWGDDAGAFLAVRQEVPCRGEVEYAGRIDKSRLTDAFKVAGAPVEAGGWSWMTTEAKAATTIIAVDGSRRIVGVGRTTRSNSRAEMWLGQKFNDNLGWYGYARVLDDSTLHFYALSSDGRDYCLLGGVGNVR